MLHVVNLDMMHATARHHPDGRPKDQAEGHRRDVVTRQRQARMLAFGAMAGAIGHFLRACLAPRSQWSAQAKARGD